MKQISVNARPVEWDDTMTVSILLQKLAYSFELVVVKVNGILIKTEAYSSTYIPEGADVMLLHLSHGG